jgi:hypothetical protein
MQEHRMNIGDSPFSHPSTNSAYSSVWAEFQEKTDTKDTKKPSRKRPEVEQVYELQAGTIKVSIRENLVCIVSDRVS